MEPRFPRLLELKGMIGRATVHFGSILTMEISTRIEDFGVTMAAFDGQVYVPMAEVKESYSPASSFESALHDKPLKPTHNALSIFNSLDRGIVWHSKCGYQVMGLTGVCLQSTFPCCAEDVLVMVVESPDFFSWKTCPTTKPPLDCF
jgi:hypothetical protein